MECENRTDKLNRTEEENEEMLKQSEEAYWLEKFIEEKKAVLLNDLDNILDIRYPEKFLRKDRNLIVNEEKNVSIRKKGLTPGVYDVIMPDGTTQVMNIAEVVSCCKTLYDEG